MPDSLLGALPLDISMTSHLGALVATDRQRIKAELRQAVVDLSERGLMHGCGASVHIDHVKPQLDAMRPISLHELQLTCPTSCVILEFVQREVGGRASARSGKCRAGILRICAFFRTSAFTNGSVRAVQTVPFGCHSGSACCDPDMVCVMQASAPASQSGSQADMVEGDLYALAKAHFDLRE